MVKKILEIVFGTLGVAFGGCGILALLLTSF